MKRRYAKERHLGSVPIDLNMDITNFGPVSKGSVKIRPLTIFVGPNNSGKSYVAMLIHSFLTAANKLSPSSKRYQFTTSNRFREFYDLLGNDMQEIVKRNEGKESFDIPTSVTKKIFASITKERFGKDLELEITRNFGSTVCDLVRAKQKLARINVSNSRRVDISINKKFNVQTNLKFNAKYKVRVSKEHEFNPISQESDPHIIHIDESSVANHGVIEIIMKLVRSIRREVGYSEIPANSFYFPAARSGILQGHKALSASIINSAQFGGIQSFQIPKLPGVVSDFISEIIVLDPDHKRLFFDLAQQLESDLLHGHVNMLTEQRGSFPEITYQSEMYKIPLHRTSSTISEIAPLSLYLKHIVGPSSLLIIEEPEAHLHPDNHLIFAKYIVRMIRAGLNVLITTHSVFMLEQLGKFVLACKIKPEIREKKLGFGRDDFLSPDEVSPYVFVRKDYNDHHILPIETNDEDGISQEEFLKVVDVLHSESIKLHKNLSKV